MMRLAQYGSSDYPKVSAEWLMTPDPLVLNMNDYKVENGANGAHNTVNVMPKEMLDQMTAQHNAHIEVLQNLADRLMDLTERLFNRFAGKDPAARK